MQSEFEKWANGWREYASKHIQELYPYPAEQQAATDRVKAFLADPKNHQFTRDVIATKLHEEVTQQPERTMSQLIDGVNAIGHQSTARWTSANPSLQESRAASASFLQRMAHPGVLINGGGAALSLFGAAQTLMHAKTVDEKGQSHYQATPLVLGFIEGVMGATFAYLAAQSFRQGHFR